MRSGVRDVAPVAEVITQSYREGGTRVDLVGIDEEKVERVLIEAKFRADLQPTQPTAYLNRLTGDGATVLLFVVPEDRSQLLWPDLRNRLSHADMGFSDVDGERRCIRIERTDKHLMVISWGSLLDCMIARSREEQERTIESDIIQLRGLAEYAESEEFRPIREREERFGSDSESARGDRDLRRMIDRVTDHGVNAGWLDRKGLNRTPRPYGYGRYVRFPYSGAEPWFGINYDLYKETGDTPLWLWFGVPSPTRRGCLRPSQFEAVNRALRATKPDGWFPLLLKRNVELDQVVDDLIAQFESLVEVISSVDP